MLLASTDPHPCVAFFPSPPDQLPSPAHCTITNWELNRTTPALRFLPCIVGFLGYAPWGDGASVGKRLLTYRRERGLSQVAFARLLRVDPGTLSRWERGLRTPTDRDARLAETLLRSSDR